MSIPPDAADALLAALRSALTAQGSNWADAPLQLLPDKGLAHAHVRIAGSGLLARIPKQSQMGLPAATNLAYQRACFERAAASGHTPRLLGLLQASASLPRGALLVEEIVGRPAQLPGDLPAIVAALAAIHQLPVPSSEHRAPLLDAADPLRGLLDEVQLQAVFLARARLQAGARQAIDKALASFAMCCARDGRPARQLIAFDGHPGNFIVRADGGAVLVDLEKCRYSHAGLDLAHATLYTSTTWDPQACAVLSLPEVEQAYAVWEAQVGAAAATAARPWHVPLRRAMWLWSITWCAKWRVVSQAQRAAGPDGEDWSAGRSDAALVAHVRDRVDHYLSAAVVARVLAEFDALDRTLAR